MGTFLGHAALGTWFFLAGIFFFLRTLDNDVGSKMRSNKNILIFEPVFRVIGGFVEGAGEVVGILRDGPHHSHTQHLVMSSCFCIGGLLQIMYHKKYLRGEFWFFSAPISFVLVASLFHFHQQDDTFMQTAHSIVGLLLLCSSVTYSWENFAPSGVAANTAGAFTALLFSVIGSFCWDMGYAFHNPVDHSGHMHHSHGASVEIHERDRAVTHAVAHGATMLVLTAILSFVMERRVQRHYTPTA